MDENDHATAHTTVRKLAAVQKLAEQPGWVRWWEEQAHNTIEMMRPKVTGYGARDLEQIGLSLADLIGREVDTQDATLLGTYFYLRGKLARWEESIKEGREVSRDTLLDLGVYALMALRVHDCGSWPGPDTVDKEI